MNEPWFWFGLVLLAARDVARRGVATPAAGKLTKTQIVALASRTGFPDPNLAAAVAMAESGGNSQALASTAKEYSVGLWQVNMKAHTTWTEAQLRDPATNAQAALSISSHGKNWTPWSAYTNGTYKAFL